MGVGIAYAFATSGYRTVLVEPSAERREQARATIAELTSDGVRRGKLTADQARDACAAVTSTATLDAVPGGCAIVVETVPERFDLKVDVLRAAEQRRPDVLASNTSALSIEKLAAELDEPSHFLGTHFFNPVWSLHLVELVTSSATAPSILEAARTVVADLGKEVAVVRDSPGFATSRLDLVAALEAMRMVQEGVASPADIDRAMTTAYRHPVGPLRLSDIVGLDVRLDISHALSRSLGRHFAPPEILVDLVARGHLGQKTGRGFYEWT